MVEVKNTHGVTKIRGIIFDWSGVVIDEIEATGRAHIDVIKKFTGIDVSYEEWRTQIGSSWQSFYLRHDVEAPQLSQVLAQFQLEYQKYKFLVKPVPGILEVLAAVKQAHYITAVLSNQKSSIVLASAQNHNLFKYFDLIIAADDLKKAKPHPEALFQVLQMLHLKPEEVLLLEDMKDGIQMGLEAGVITIGIRSKLEQDLSMASWCLENVIELLDILDISLNTSSTQTEKDSQYQNKRGAHRMSITVDDSIFQMFGKIQNYAWGGYNFIPTLIGRKPEPGITYAEYWMGAHEKAPSEILQNDGSKAPLNNIIKEQPEKTLGIHVAQKYGSLPYLFKILDVREMLSIQVHPTKAEAEIGFAKENEMGIPLDSPTRNYKDDNHKPELQMALTDFWSLHAFQPEDQIYETLNQIPEFNTLISIFAQSGYIGLYKHIMEMSSEIVDLTLNPLVKRILAKYEDGILEKTSPDYWAARAIQENPSKHYDRGIFSIYLFNLIRLKPGQAIFQDAGIPHAALQGLAIEIMANSDNVIRGGLTPKHIDLPQLLKLTTFKGLIPEIIESKPASNLHEAFYQTPSHDFCLSKIQMNQGDLYTNTSYSTEIMLVISGETMLDATDKEIPVKKGESIVVFAEKNYRIKALSEDVLIFKASIPII